MSMRRLIFSLRQSKGFVHGANFENGDLRALAAQTVALSLESAKIDDDGIFGLPKLPGLRCLDLDNTKISDKCLAVVARFPALEELWLECTSITDAGLQELHVQKCLKFVSVAYTKVTPRGIALLRSAIPEIEISA